MGNGKYTKQHQATIDQLVKPYPEEWQTYLKWFKRMPLFVELPGLRVVHAAWDPAAIRTLGDRSFADNDFLRRSATKGTAEFTAVSLLLKGPEIPLPSGFAKQDSEGNTRNDMRVAWWKHRIPGRQYTYRQLSIPGAGEMPDEPIPPADLAHCPDYDPQQRPVIFGHYWLPNDARAL